MRRLCLCILIFICHNSFAIHLGKVDPHSISPVGAIVKIETSDFKYAKSFGYYPSIKVKCSLVRIAKNKAITNTHCVYPYINEQGKWLQDEHHSIFVSFSKDLSNYGKYSDIKLYPIKKIIQQINYNDNQSVQKWNRYLNYADDITWEEIINYFVPRDIAIIEFEVDPRENKINIAKLQSSNSYLNQIPVTVSGYGPVYFDKLDNNGIRRVNSGTLVKRIPSFFENDNISWFVGVRNQGGLPTDSGGFIGEIKQGIFDLHGLIVIAPYEIETLDNETKKYYSAIKQFRPRDIVWINKMINKLNQIKNSNSVEILYNDIMKNGDVK